MKKLAITLFAGITAVAMMTSCGENSSAYKKLQKQYDSLAVVSQQSGQNLDAMLSIINEVEENFKEISKAENFVTVKRSNGDLNASTKDEIRNNMLIISQTLKNNREQLIKLEKSSSSSKQLKQTVRRLMKQLEEKESELNTLRNELAARDIRINELDSAVVDLNKNVQDLQSTAQQQSKTIQSQDADLHRAYYCFGSMQELKEQKILAGGGIFSSLKVLPDGFNKDYFLSLDTREVSTIALFAPKARVRTQHPSGSYEFVKDNDGNLSLHILDTKEFWSLSKYLVIEVTL